MKTRFKWWSRIGAVFLTLFGLDVARIEVRDLHRETINQFGFFSWDLTGIAVTFFIFTLWFLPYFLPTIPLWYYGFKKDN